MRGPGPFWIVDVFAERKYAGNQLAVFTDAAHLPTETMQAIARETNYSETTFVTGRRPDGAWTVRIFTPSEELPFAGHPTLGTAWVLRETQERNAREVRLDLKVGEIPVQFALDGILWMTQMAPTFGETVPRATVAKVLRLHEDDVDATLPVQVVSTGLPALIVPLASKGALGRARIDPEAYEALRRAAKIDNVFPFSRGGHSPDADYAARMFSPGIAVAEDPATGSANGCFAAYLSRHKVGGSEKVDALVDQGVEMGRPSRLHLRAAPAGESIKIEVGGRVVPVARGEFV